MLSFVILNVFMLSVAVLIAMLCVVILGVVAPKLSGTTLRVGF
jgi:hypothetical protein